MATVPPSHFVAEDGSEQQWSHAFTGAAGKPSRVQVGWVRFAEGRMHRFMHMHDDHVPGEGWQPMWADAP